MAFNELPGYPKEDWSRRDGRVVRKWRGPWTDRRSFSIPYQYTPFELYKDTVQILGVGAPTVSGDETVYDEATIEVTYTPMSGGTLLAKAKGLDETWEFNISYNVEHLSIPSRKLVWGSDDVVTDKPIQRIVPSGEVTLTKRDATSIPEAAFDACRGNGNKGIFLGYAEATLLFLGATSHGIITHDGAEGLSYTLKFAKHCYDWRYVWRGDSGKGIWDWVYVPDTTPTKYLYELVSFAGLIA